MCYSEQSESAGILEGFCQSAQNARVRELCRGHSKNTSVRSKGVFEKTINLASTSIMSRGGVWKGRGRLTRRTSRAREVNCCGTTDSSGSAEEDGLRRCSAPTRRPLTRSLWTTSKCLSPVKAAERISVYVRGGSSNSSMTNSKVVGPYGLHGELPKVLADERKSLCTIRQSLC